MKVAVLLSGGVDSSVALNLVKREGRHDMTAFYLKIWLEEELAFLGDCPWEEDLQNARAVCEQAGVPLRVIPMQTEYQEKIVSHVLSELKQGRTPSPDILCNQHIKFGLFEEKIDPSFEKVASGHYAQIEFREGKYLLKRSPDPVKDQTYFLAALSQKQLSRAWFPIGHLEKRQVRQLAHEMELPNRERKDSQGICFLGKIKYPEFVRFHLGEKRGEIIEMETGKKLAEHRGAWFYTVGQRKGLGMGGGPWYVVGKEIATNRVYVSRSEHYLEHARLQYTVANVHWNADAPVKRELQTKVRHSPHLADCTIRSLENDRWEVTLKEKDQGIASGQWSIFYDGEICLGGGVIE
jgi:tRNA-5-taurinomethyluridine 2-sulfurtransferase